MSSASLHPVNADGHGSSRVKAFRMPPGRAATSVIQRARRERPEYRGENLYGGLETGLGARLCRGGVGCRLRLVVFEQLEVDIGISDEQQQ